MVLPLLVTPFLTMIFWALGGGQGTASALDSEGESGLNPQLPGAHFKNEKNAWDKLALYEKAQRDSTRYREAKRRDPYVNLPPLRAEQDSSTPNGNVNTSLGRKVFSVDENEARVHRKIDELNKALNAPQERKPRYEPTQAAPADPRFSHDVERLESMMDMMQSGTQEDKEMQQIQTVLDKILDIQHPERVQTRLKHESEKNPTKAFAVSQAPQNVVSSFGNSAMDTSSVLQEPPNVFYGLADKLLDDAHNAVEAMISHDQSLVSGASVRLTLLSDIYIGGQLIQKGKVVFGQCSLNGERLSIEISSIHIVSSILPVSLTVHDLDGIEGIYVPGAIARDVAKQSSGQALQNIGLTSFDPSFEAQAASAGIETVKSLLSKRSRLIKVTVKAGYKVLLVDKHNN
jgi:conjugative transposon TraM protein